MAEDINGAIQTGIGICFDETHGYNRYSGTRELNPDTDCSYFVWYCLHMNGFNVGSSGFDTTTEGAVLRNAGFTEYVWNSSFVPQHGDIFMYDQGGGPNGHTFFYAENVTGYVNGYLGYSNCDGTIGLCAQAKVEASNDRGHPEPGDQANSLGCHGEVWVHTYDSLVYNTSTVTWYVYRWGGTPPPPPPVSRRGKLPVWLIDKIIKEGSN